MNWKVLLIILGMCLVSGEFQAQEQNREKLEVGGKYKRTLEMAEFLFSETNYLRALVLYDSLIEKYPSELYYQYQAGICNIHKSDGREDAITILSGLDGSYNEVDDVKFYIGRAYHLLYEFDKAIGFYNTYLKEAQPQGERRTYTLYYIENCKTGRKLMERRTNLALEILIPPSTSHSSQYSPVISSDGKTMLFTNRGKENIGGMMLKTMKERPEGDYFEDIWVTYNTKDGWTEAQGISNNINTEGHEAPMSFSSDGSKMLLYKSNKDSREDIYISEYFDGAWTRPDLIEGQVNSVHWEGSACLTRDGKHLYFSSDRPGGYGGRDLYVAEWINDSIWGNVKNLGPTINTKFDEDGPFFHADGKSLYFASIGHNSMGGYDIFHSQLQEEDTTWTNPINIGYPINTTDDDRFYVVSDDGRSGYFSSARASGENRHDIYEVQPGSFERMTNLVVLFGVVKVDEKPAAVRIMVEDAISGKPLGEFLTDEEDGKFNFILLPSSRYKLTLITEGAEPLVEYVEVKEPGQTFIRLEKNFKLYTFAYAMLHGDRNADPLSGVDEDDQLFQVSTPVHPDDEEARAKEAAANKFFKLNKDGYWVLARDIEIDELDVIPEDMAAVGLYFRVQVGAYRNPGRFTYGFLRQLGSVEIKTYPDGITRYLMGQKFTVRADAEVLRQKCIKAGQEDTWITIR